MTTQHKDEELSWQREEFLLQLAILNEQKMSKLIQLVDELRKNQMEGDGTVDREADAMSSSEDLKHIQDSVMKNRERIVKAENTKI